MLCDSCRVSVHNVTQINCNEKTMLIRSKMLNTTGGMTHIIVQNVGDYLTSTVTKNCACSNVTALFS